jgi:hypothetical protein
VALRFDFFESDLAEAEDGVDHLLREDAAGVHVGGRLLFEHVETVTGLAGERQAGGERYAGDCGDESIRKHDVFWLITLLANRGSQDDHSYRPLSEPAAIAGVLHAHP